MFLIERDKYYKDFTRTIKIFNSQWECSEISESVDLKGNHFLSCSIVVNYTHNPTMQDCIAIADYLKVKYCKGYFFRKI